MATDRKLVFVNGEVYHLLNRGVEKRQTFTQKRELQRATDTFVYYRFADLSFRFSHFMRLDKDSREIFSSKLKDNMKQVDILAYCLMPNHFHFLVRQNIDKGISKFMANFQNSYTKYFNTKNDRVGPLFQGLFKAVHIESDEQLMHVSRYIHLNPVSSFILESKDLEMYEWSSYQDYINTRNPGVVEVRTILDLFSDKGEYKKFVLDYADYARQVEKIKHLVLDE